MKVVMLKDVKGVGQRGAVVEMADGFALNSLIPQGKAVQATPDKIAEVQRRLAAEKASSDAKASQLASKIGALDGTTITMKAKVNDKGHLFKAIKKDDIAKALGVDDDVVDLEDALKSAGEHTIALSSGSAKARVTLVIAAQ